MGGSYEIDVMAAVLLQAEHHAGNFFGAAFAPPGLPTQLEILAEDTVQVTRSEEDGSGSIPATKAIFFSLVREKAIHSGHSPGCANPNGSFQAVDVASTRTQITILQNCQALANSLLQLTRAPALKIRGFVLASNSRRRLHSDE
jgi:hypothetical protein